MKDCIRVIVLASSYESFKRWCSEADHLYVQAFYGENAEAMASLEVDAIAVADASFYLRPDAMKLEKYAETRVRRNSCPQCKY